MTSKCGQKCTAIRRVIVPDHLIEDVQIALGKELGRIAIGNPTADGVRMGALASKAQVQEVIDRVTDISKTAEIVYGSLDSIDLVDADFDKGAFLSPILMLEKDPFKNTAVHDVEAFGPVSTLMPYTDLDQAIELSQMGKGSLCCSIATYDDAIAREFVIGAASHHGRILVLNRENAKQSTGHGSPLPTLVHGGPGRAGGGEEMGGMRGIEHYLQRCAVQGSPTTLTAVTGIYQPGAKVIEAEKHPFKYHFEDIQPGMSILTHKRTMTDSDIQNFANLTWDVFYAHTDITSLKGTIFEKRAAHGYFILAAAAGLFVHPSKGPVGANYGIDECRFIRPIYHNDTIQVRLTCKEKIDRDTAGKAHPSGVVKWYEEVFDQDGELVAMATILTLVQKKNPLPKVDRDSIQTALNNLTEDTKPTWGILTPQHMIEHLEWFCQIALGNIKTEQTTPEKHIDKMQASLYDYTGIPQNFEHPLLRKGKLEDLRYANLDIAKEALINGLDQVDALFKADQSATIPNPVFGDLNAYDWQLYSAKHAIHHFTQFNLI